MPSSDPTLTVENMKRIMAKVEQKAREDACERILDHKSKMKIQEQYPIDTERVVAYLDVYINCYPWTTWQRLAKVLYQRHQVAAVEEVKAYLPPRGDCRRKCVYTIIIISSVRS